MKFSRTKLIMIYIAVLLGGYLYYALVDMRFAKKGKTKSVQMATGALPPAQTNKVSQFFP